MMMYPPGYNAQAIDECNFSMSSFGKGYRWDNLPVPITVHSKYYPKKSLHSTIKVIDEWNQTWRASGQDTDLFHLLGKVDYETAEKIQDDDLNSLIVVDSDENRGCVTELNGRCFLQRAQQGVTSIRGKGFSSVAEADVFINTDDYEYYFEDEDNVQLASNRGIASYKEPVSFLEKFWAFLSNLFYGDRRPTSRSSRAGFVPSHMVDFESLIAHELGHVLALGHNDVRGSIMNTSLALGVKRRGLRKIELDSLLCGYGE